MPSVDTPDLDLLIAQSRAAAAEAQANEAAAEGRSPAPGEVYVLPETADFPVEWALIERHPDDPRRFWAVPADLHPFASEDDVAIPAGEPGGGIVLRCAHGTWLPEAALMVEKRSRVLTPEILDEARVAVAVARERRWADPSGPTGSGSPELDDWTREVLHPACEAATAIAAPRPALPALPPRPLSWRFWAAAAALLVVLAGLLGMSLDPWRLQAERKASAESSDLRRQLSAAEETQQSQEEHWQKQTAAVEQQGQAEIQKLQRRVAELEGGSSRAEPLANLPWITLRPAEVLRAEPSALQLPAESPYLLVSLLLPSGAKFPYYRLTLLQGARTLWQSPRLSGIRDPQISVQIPRKWLSPGTFRLRLEGIHLGETTQVAEYSLNVAP